MKDVCAYSIELRGQLSDGEISAMSPTVQLKVECAGLSSTHLTIHTDQSGLIGLLRYLHGLGYIILSMIRTENS